MKINVLKRLIPLAVLFLCVNSTWADDAATNAYLVALTAQAAPESTGEGNVKLTLVDIKGETISGGPWAYLGNEKNPSDYARSVIMLGGTITATGLELEDSEMWTGSQVYLTSYAYYKAEVQADAGSYFAGWNVSSSLVAKKAEENGCVTFKVLPDAQGDNVVAIPNGNMSQIPQEKLTKGLTAAKTNTRNVYAVFNKYLLSNPSATHIKMDNTAGSTAEITVSMDIEGDIDSLNWESDFKSLEITDNAEYWTIPDIKVKDNWELTYGSQANKVRGSFKISFKVQENMTPGTYKSTLTVSMAGENPSVLNIPIAVTVLDANRPEAVLYDGKTQKESGDLSYVLGKISDCKDPIIQLQKYCDHLSLENKSFTLDLNGNEVNGITLSGGTLTLAYSKFGGNAWKVTVNGGKLILNGGILLALAVSEGAVVEQNGATVNQQIDNQGTFISTEGLMQNGITSSGTLTVQGGTFKSTVTITDGTANIERGTILGTSCGVWAKGGTTTIKKLAAISGKLSVKADGGTVKINCGKFDGPLEGDIDFTAGYFKDNKNYGVPTDGKTELRLTTGVEYNEGYHWFLGTQDAAMNNGVGVCRIGETGYATLEDALAYANNNKDKEVIIFMTNNYTLPAGHYTLPAKATIVVPMSDSQENMVNEVAPKIVFHSNQSELDKKNNHYSNNKPTEYRRLTFAKGVNMDVFGAIEMTCTQYSSDEAYTGQPVGPYGHLVMEEGSHMTLQSGSQLRAWGFMTGKGETDARRGATVHEFFQMGDWKGAITSASIAGIWGNDGAKKIFPVSQYFIQNIESPVKYHPGAVLTTVAAVSDGVKGLIPTGVSMAANDIKIIGVNNKDVAIFLMENEADAENTWVKKSYIVDKDIQNYEVNSGAHIGSMVIDLGTLPLGRNTVPIILNSANFDLPITSNMKLHLLSGSMDFTQNTSLLPGSEVEVDKESTVTITMNPTDVAAKEANEVDHVYHSGALYVYDSIDWKHYAYQNEYDVDKKEYSTEKCCTKIVRYAPSWGGRPDIRKENKNPNPAKINVHGTFNTADGYVYTSAGGADILSSNGDAGTFIFNHGTDKAGTPTVYNVEGESDYKSLTFYPAYLKNGDGSYTKTYTDETHFAAAGEAYCYSNNKWSIWKVAEDNECFMTVGTDYYAKPQEYVKVVATKNASGNLVGNNDNTYSDAAGTGRLFILMGDDCQWWEVEEKDNLYHCIHPNNDTYYEWNDNDEKWQETKYTITWKNWNGDTIQTTALDAGKDEELVKSYSVPYGTMAEFLGSNPTRDADIDYTYDFTGWTPALGKVTSDVTYTATYERKPRKYTITFCNEGGSVIERQFLTHNEVPVCENVPTKIGHYLQWSPAIAAVTGDATYTATWLEEKPTEYEVRFVDYDGTPLLKKPLTMKVGDTPEYNGTTPTGKAKKAEEDGNKEFTYEFAGWSPKIHKVDAAITYTAVYTEVAKTYTITFQNEDGVEIETKQYEYGAIPVCSQTPTEPNDADYAQYTYTFAWTPQIEAVREDKTYKAEWSTTTNKYTVTLTSNMPNAVILTGAGIYDYNSSVILHAQAKGGFVFKGWKETNKTEDISLTVKADATYTAIVERATPAKDYTVAAGETWDAAGQTVKNLILCSDGTQSGQIKNITGLTLDGNAYFDLTLNAVADRWYAIAVPWIVNVSDIRFDGASRTANRDFFLLTYNGDVRAAQGPVDACWNFIADGALQPGKSYMLYLRSGATIIRFPKKAGASLAGGSVSVYAYPSQTGNGIDGGWNGIANPVAYYTALKTGTTEYGQKYKAADDSYELIKDLDSHTFVVGEPVFVQANSTIDRVPFLDINNNNPSAAPRRLSATTAQPATYEVRIAAQRGSFTDRLYISAAEEKEDTYVIGQDLAKMGVSTRVAQMWINRYDARLCVNVTELANSQAEFPLGIYAPKSGTYTIATPTALPDNEELYVTVNGKPVWSLANGEYLAALNAGNTDNYGLLLVRKAPQITTDSEQTEQDNTLIRKVLINGQVYIIREGNVYSIFGQKIQ